MRQAIPKKVRFEVFKRDSFKCQYCGAAAPTVELRVDHIKPVADGGTNDILNLVTACESCNAGKGARLLSDDAAVQKQKAQLDKLQERREQLAAMVAWRDELAAIEADMLADASAEWTRLTGAALTGHGIKTMKKSLKRFGLSEVLDAIEIAIEKHPGDLEAAFDLVGRVCAVRRAQQERPYLRDLMYVRGICRNRFTYTAPWLLDALEDAHRAGVAIDDLKTLAKRSRNWTVFRDELEATTTRAKAS